LNIAKADRIPDVDLGFGVRQFEEDNSYTFVAGLSVPLPLFNRNQGSIQEAAINKDKVVVDKKILLNELLIKLNEYYQEYNISLQQVASYKNSILPSTQEYYDLTVNSYEQGSLDYLDALVAERKLIETKKKYEAALHTLQNSVANLENLCSQHFHGINGEVF
jgi:cobalt-zinc-cadmium efflux system outer membrane protein